MLPSWLLGAVCRHAPPSLHSPGEHAPPFAQHHMCGEGLAGPSSGPLASHQRRRPLPRRGQRAPPVIGLGAHACSGGRRLPRSLSSLHPVLGSRRMLVGARAGRGMAGEERLGPNLPRLGPSSRYERREMAVELVARQSVERLHFATQIALGGIPSVQVRFPEHLNWLPPASRSGRAQDSARPCRSVSGVSLILRIEYSTHSQHVKLCLQTAEQWLIMHYAFHEARRTRADGGQELDPGAMRAILGNSTIVVRPAVRCSDHRPGCVGSVLVVVDRSLPFDRSVGCG